MAAESGLPDLSTLSGWGAFILSLGGVVHLHGRQSRGLAEAAKDAEKALDAAKAVADSLAAFKQKAAEEFVTQKSLEQMEGRIITRIDRQDDRNDRHLGQIASRLDQIAEGRFKAP